MVSFFKKDPTKSTPSSKPTKVILNENEQKHYYCPKRKRFVFEGEEEEEDKPLPPPPKKGDVKAKESEPLKEKTEFESMTAPPAYSRSKKKAAKEKIIQPMVVPLLPQPIDFAEYRRRLSDMFEEASHNLSETGCSNKVVEHVLDNLYRQLDKEE